MTVQEDITTIFVVGFPDDMKEREFQNLFIFAEGFEGAVLKIPSSYTIQPTEKDINPINQPSILQDCDTATNVNRRHSTCGISPISSTTPKKQIIGFARFKTQDSAKKAIETLSGRKIDPEKCSLVMKAEFAKKNLLQRKGSICVTDYVHNIANIFASSTDTNNNTNSMVTDVPSIIPNTPNSNSNGSSDYYSLSSISHLPPPPLPPMMLNTINPTQPTSPVFHHRHSIHNYPSYVYDPYRLPIPTVLTQPCYPRATPSYAPPHHHHKNHSPHSNNDTQPNNQNTTNELDDNDAFGTSVPNCLLSSFIKNDNNTGTAMPQLHRSHSLVDMKLMNHSLLEDVEDCYQQHDSFLSESNEPEEMMHVTRDMFPFLDDDEESKKHDSNEKIVSRVEKELSTISLPTIQEYGDEKTKLGSDSVLFQPGFMSVFGGSTFSSTNGTTTSLTIRPPRHNYDDSLCDSSRQISKHMEPKIPSSGRSLGSCEYRFLSDTPPPHLSTSGNINQSEEREYSPSKIRSGQQSQDEIHAHEAYSFHSTMQQSCSNTQFKVLPRMTGNDCDKNDFDDNTNQIDSNDANQTPASIVTSNNGITTVLSGTGGVPRIFRNGPNGVLYPIGENPPCNTLYVGNLPMTANEDELRELFQSCPGYKRLSFKMKPNGPMCFVEFDDVQCATNAMNELYGTMLTSSTKGGIRLSYSKNPLGVRPPGSLPKSLVNMIANQMMANGTINCHPGMIQHQGTLNYGGIPLSHPSISTPGLHSHNTGMYYPQSHGSLYTHPHIYPHNLHDGQSMVPYYANTLDENVHGNFHLGYHEKSHDGGNPTHDPSTTVSTGVPHGTGEVLNGREVPTDHQYYYDNGSTTIVS